MSVILGGGAPASYVNGRTFDNTVIVKKASDLLNGIDSNKTYFIDGSIDMEGATIFIDGNGLSLYSDDLNKKGLMNVKFTFVPDIEVGNINFADMFVYAPNGGDLFENMNSDNFSAAEFVNVNFGTFSRVSKGGTLSNFRQLLFTGCAFIRFRGFNLAEDFTGVKVSNSIALSMPANETLFERGDAFNIQNFRCEINFASVDPTSKLLDFGEENISTDGGLQLKNCLSTATNPTPNITSASVKSFFSDNIGIVNTFIGSSYTFSTEQTTVITASNTPTKIAGVTTVSNGQAWFESNGNNSEKYISSQENQFRLTASLSATGSNNRVIAIYFRKFNTQNNAYEDNFIERPKFSNSLNGGISGSRAENISVGGNVTLNKNDRIELWAENLTDSTNFSIEVGGLVEIVKR